MHSRAHSSQHQSVKKELRSPNQQLVAGLTQTMQAALHFGFDPMQGSSCILAGLTPARVGLSDPCGVPISVYSTILDVLFMSVSTAHHSQLACDEIKSLPTL